MFFTQVPNDFTLQFPYTEKEMALDCRKNKLCKEFFLNYIQYDCKINCKLIIDEKVFNTTIKRTKDRTE